LPRGWPLTSSLTKRIAGREILGDRGKNRRGAKKKLVRKKKKGGNRPAIPTAPLSFSLTRADGLKTTYWEVKVLGEGYKGTKILVRGLQRWESGTRLSTSKSKIDSKRKQGEGIEKEKPSRVKRDQRDFPIHQQRWAEQSQEEKGPICPWGKKRASWEKRLS